MFSDLFGFPRPKRSSFKIRRGLDLPVSGRPDQAIHSATPTRSVGLCLQDYAGFRASPLVREGDSVKLGEPLLRDRKHPEIVLTSPGCGTVETIESGPHRTIRSVTVRLEGSSALIFPACSEAELESMSATAIRSRLVKSGLWTSLRTRPFGRIPSPESEAPAIFVRAIDSNPLAADPGVIIARYFADFTYGLEIISRLTEGPIFLCRRPGTAPVPKRVDRLRAVDFRGPHPAGLVGTHIHRLFPVGQGRAVWHLDYQDTIAIGQLFRTGEIPTGRIIALGGPAVRRPRLLETRVGCHLGDLLEDELAYTECRVISGSVLSGRQAFGSENFLGRYHSQISVIPEARHESAGRRRKRAFSFYSVLPSAGLSRYPFSTALGSRPTSMLPLDAFERVMPLDILPTPLLRALAVGDVEQARALGCLELEEEDLALCTFLCPGKLDYGTLLRSTLSRLEREA